MAKAALTLDQVRNFCVFCGKIIPIERLKRNAVTCSKLCAKDIERQRMLLLEQRECKYCRRPSTPEEREEFKAFRKWQKDRDAIRETRGSVPGLLLPEEEDTQEEATEENTDEVTEEQVVDEAIAQGERLREYPYFYTRFNSNRKGQRCRILRPQAVNSNASTHCQIQFEDGETQIADKIHLSRTWPKKFSGKGGRPRKSESTLAAKQDSMTHEGE